MKKGAESRNKLCLRVNGRTDRWGMHTDESEDEQDEGGRQKENRGWFEPTARTRKSHCLDEGASNETSKRPSSLRGVCGWQWR